MIYRIRKTALFLLLMFFTSFSFAQQEVKPVKNVILMIPDGTSIGVYSAARWYKVYNNMGDDLHHDPYFTGTVSTFSSNEPIGDSAPTTSTYMTGIPSRAGWVATYPLVDPGNDLYPLDSTMAYQPLATILEASRIEQNKATGLVVTCEFPHATPADCAAHYYNRGNYDVLAPQMAYQNLDVMFGGGNGILTDDMKQHFQNSGTTLIQDDRDALLNYNDDKRVWALFGDRAVPFDIDRNPEEVPSLAEMTQKSLDILSKNENGFFLMVEGSAVDWAAHANDPVGIITEFIAFDEAVGKVMNFAKKDGETAVVILSDHGNSGFTIGKRGCKGKSLSDLFGPVSKIKLTSHGIETKLIDTRPEKMKEEFKKYTDIDLTDDELESLLSSKNYTEGDYTEVANSPSLRNNIISIMNSRMCFGFTTGGHTGEEVLLAAYHPDGHVPMGHVKNTDINDYLFKVSGLKTPLPELTQRIFAKHTEVFAGFNYSIENKDSDIPILVVKNGKSILEIPAFSSVGKLNGESFNLGSVTVYIDKKDTFYLPKNMADKLK
ncbi:MAG TPA: alkaline phosphatase [Dysgonamonadaceae bacterium]|nr:alkaline phosphatase [Dysgonamonadaceae bacterium]